MTNNKKTTKYVIAALGSGITWGFMPLFSRFLTAEGMSSYGVVIGRCGTAAICFGLLILFTDINQFRIKRKDLWCFFGTGILSLLFFSYCYFTAVNMISMAAAATLLYIAPTVVMILSIILFKEQLTGLKVLEVILAFSGCALVSGITTGFDINVTGVLFGIASGVGYALYTIFSRYALIRGYTGNTINFYSTLFATIGIIIISAAKGPMEGIVIEPKTILLCLGIGSFSCFLPYMLYTYSLEGLDNSKSSMLASTEPVVSALLGVFIFHEKMTVSTGIGIMLVITAIILLNIQFTDKTHSSG